VTDFGLFQTQNAEMAQLLQRAEVVAMTPAPVLISGERGVGKTLLTQLLCEKGQWTQGLKRWDHQGRGLPELNSGDWVLIEGLEEMDSYNQVALSQKMDELRAQNFRIRWIATTAARPQQLFAEKKIRDDLFYRLSVIHLAIPSLQVRPEDILPLSEFFMKMFSVMRNRSGMNFADSAAKKLQAHTWPGNVAELENVIERAISLATDDVIDHDLIQFDHPNERAMAQMGTTLSDMEKKLILQTLQLTRQNKTRAAQILGISIRTLRNKLNIYREQGLVI